MQEINKPFNWWGAGSGCISDERTRASELDVRFQCHLLDELIITSRSSSEFDFEGLWRGERLPHGLGLPFLGIE